MMLIVPNHVRDAINAKLDAALAQVPDAIKDRDHLYNLLLAYFDKHGDIPDFDLVPRTEIAEHAKANRK